MYILPILPCFLSRRNISECIQFLLYLQFLQYIQSLHQAIPDSSTIRRYATPSRHSQFFHYKEMRHSTKPFPITEQQGSESYAIDLGKSLWNRSVLSTECDTTAAFACFASKMVKQPRWDAELSEGLVSLSIMETQLRAPLNTLVLSEHYCIEGFKRV